MFSDVKIKIEFLVDTKRFKITPHTKTDYDKFQLKFIRKKDFFLSNSTAHTSLKLLDIHGEVLLKDLFKSLDSSVGRAKD